MKLIILILSIANTLFIAQASSNESQAACTVCNCDHTRVNCHSKGLIEVPNNIPSETTQLILGTNPIEEIKISSFYDLLYLQRLYLDATQISTLQAGAFKSLSSMTLLNLAENPNLKQLPSNLFEGLTNLKELYLNQDNIEYLEKDIFKQLNELSILQLQGNQLQSLEALYRGGIGNSTKLYISDNPLICCKNNFWTSEGILKESVSDEPECTEEVTDRVIKNVSNLGLPPPPIVNFRPTKNNTVYLNWTQDASFANVSESEIFYRVDTKIKSELKNLISNTSSVLISNLTFDLTYELVVRTKHADGKLSPANCPLRFTISDYAPSNLTLEVNSSTSLILNWDPPQITDTEETGTIQSYYIYLTDNEGFGDIGNVTIPRTQRTYLFTNLEESARYTVHIAAVTELGLGPASTASNTTLADRPTEGPRNFNYTEIGGTYISLSWDPPPKIKQNGNILQYVLVYYRVGQSDDKIEKIETLQNSFNVTNLSAFVEYEFKIAAENIIGPGENITLIVKTNQDAPTAPRNITVLARGTKSIYISWEIPESTNGILSGYSILVTSEAENFSVITNKSNQTMEYNATGLEEFTNYSIAVFGSTKAGAGMSITITEQTLAAKPTAEPSNLINVTVTQETIGITWVPIKDSELNGDLEGYSINYTNTDASGTITSNNSLSKTNSYKLVGLHPAYTYTITVSVKNQIGQGPASENLTVTTLEAEPNEAPRLLYLTSESPFTLRIIWEDPPISKRNGILTETGIIIQRIPRAGSEENHLPEEFRENVPSADHQFTYNNMDSPNPGYNNYSVRIFSSTSVGKGPESDLQYIQTETRAPILQPTNIEVSSPNSTSLILNWTTNMDNYQYGIITKYEVVVEESEIMSLVIEASTQNAFSILITNLNEYTRYNITIVPFTSAGSSIETRNQVVHSRTQQGVPTRAANDSRIQIINDTSLNVTWSLPSEDDSNGIITQFEIRYGECGMECSNCLDTIQVPENQASFNKQLNGLTPKTCYEVKISASTIAGSSNFTEITGKTLPENVQCPRYYESMNYSETMNVVDPCRNKAGICMDDVGPLGYTCMCPHGYEGDICNATIDYCSNISCSDKGKCTSDNNGNYTCHCEAGYIGMNCSERNNTCEPKEGCEEKQKCCLNGGECIDMGNDTLGCECLPGYVGPLCHQTLNLCQPNPCDQNNTNSKCEKFFNDYQCTCTENYVGKNCEVSSNNSERCRNDIDEIFQLSWQDSLNNSIAIIPCTNLTKTLYGNITRQCIGPKWEIPDFSNCVRRQFRDLRKELKGNLTEQQTVDILVRIRNYTREAINESAGMGLIYPGELDIVNQSLNTFQSVFQQNIQMNANKERINGTMDALQILSNVFSTNNLRSFSAIDFLNASVNGSTANASVNGSTANAFVESVDAIGSFLATDINRVEEFNGDNFELKAVRTNASETALYNNNSNIGIRVSFTAQNSTSVSLAIFPNLDSFLPSTRNVATNVASISIDAGRMKEMNGGVSITFTSTKNTSNLTNKFDVIPECVFWDEERGNWNNTGLTLEGQSGNQYNCSSIHTTSFALLFNLVPKPPIPYGERLAQSIITYILTCTSLLALLSAIGLYFFMGKAFLRKRINQVHLNFCIAYAIALSLFLLQEAALNHPVACKLFALLMHYSWLTVFSWSLCEGIFIYFKFVRIFSKHKKFEMTGLVLFGWLFPLVIVIPTFGSRFHDYGSAADGQICFLGVGPPNWTYLAFILPMILLLLSNFIFLFIAIHSFQKVSRGKESKQKYKMIVLGSFVLLPVLGLPWLVGFLTLIPHSFFDWVFILVTAPQGLWFFLIHVLRNLEIRKKLSQTLCRNRKGRKRFTDSISVSHSAQSNMNVSGSATQKFKVSRVQRSDSDRRSLFSSVKSEYSTSMSVSGVEKGDGFEMTEFNQKKDDIYRRISSSYNDVSNLNDPFDPATPQDILEKEEKEFMEENFGIDLLFDEDKTSQRLSLPLLELARDVILEAVTPSEEVEIDSSNLLIVSQIHSGVFSSLHKSVLSHTDSEKYVVCMRRAKEGISKEEDIELKLMMQILRKLQRHKNILKLVGISGYRDERPKYVLEYACYGQLHAYLEACKLMDAANKLVQRYGLISWDFKDSCVKQIAAGMKYLEEEGFVHGDLAARNILVTRHLTCKITNIGSRLHPQSPPIYYSPRPEVAAIPVRWTAPECIRTGERSGKNDVWAFGITCWEIYSEGSLPFKEQNDRAVTFEVTNLQLQKAKVSERTEKMMALCWKINPSHRLNFEDLCDFINQRKLSSMNHPKKIYASLEDRTGQNPQKTPL